MAKLIRRALLKGGGGVILTFDDPNGTEYILTFDDLSGGEFTLTAEAA